MIVFHFHFYLMPYIANMAAHISEGRKWTRYFLEYTWWKGRVSKGKGDKKISRRSTFVHMYLYWRYAKCPFLFNLYGRMLGGSALKKNTTYNWLLIVSNFWLWFFCCLDCCPFSGDFKVHYMHKLYRHACSLKLFQPLSVSQSLHNSLGWLLCGLSFRLKRYTTSHRMI